MLEIRRLENSNNYYAAYTVNGRLMEPMIGKKNNLLIALVKSDADDVEHIEIAGGVNTDDNQKKKNHSMFLLS